MDSDPDQLKSRLQAYLEATSGHRPKPGADILDEFHRHVSQEEMDRDGENFVKVIQDKHAGETIIVLGTGPTLNDLDLSRFDRFTTLGCNGIGNLYHPDYYVILDPFIYGLHKDVFLSSPHTRILSSFTKGDFDLRIYYQYENLVGLSKNEIFSADNTGFVLVSMAYIMGAKRIVLAGFDGYPPGSQQFHAYEEQPVEFDRAQYEWQDESGKAKGSLIQEAFEFARSKLIEEGREIRLLTPSYYLGDIIEPIGLQELEQGPANR